MDKSEDRPWIEIKTTPDKLRSIYDLQFNRIHHFYYEPWHPNGVVVRVEGPSKWMLDNFEWEKWDPSLDERWLRFFDAGSRVGLNGLEHRAKVKLVHCLLNSWGMTVWDEFKFSLCMVKDRFRILVHDFLHDRNLSLIKCKWGCHGNKT